MILFRYKSDSTLLCYYPKGQLTFGSNNQLCLVKKPAQVSDTCWYDGPRVMFASLSCVNYSQNDALSFIEKHYQETSAIYQLEYCYDNFIDQYDTESLKKLAKHPNILNINFPKDFTERLNCAINSSERKDLLYTCLNIAITEGKERGKRHLENTLKKMCFDAGSNCLKSIGCTETETRINNINSNFDNSNKYCEAVTILQKDVIVDEMFKILSIESIEKPKNAKDLYEMLENRGPFLGRGKLGIESYMPNTAKQLKSVAESTHIFGWDSKNYINDPQSPQHAIIIVGVEVQETPDKSRVYFLDPLQPLDPKDKYMQVYSVSFSKYTQQTQNIYFLKNYGLTEEVRNLENKIKKPSSFSSGFFAEDKNKVLISQENINQPINQLPSNTQFLDVNNVYRCLMEEKKEFKLMHF